MSGSSNIFNKKSVTVFFRFDRVILFMGTVFALQMLVDPGRAYETFRFSVLSLVHMTPYFIPALIFAAYVRTSGADQLISKAFSGNAAVAVLGASLAGALSPLCSCGVIPLIAAMLTSGVPLGSVMAFCISSPIMDPEMFLVTAGGISTDFAVAKTIAAMGMGMFSGFSIMLLQKKGLLLHPLKKVQECGCGETAFNPGAETQVKWKFWKAHDSRIAFWKSLRENGFFLGKWMAAAFMLENLMIAYVPQESVGSLVGANTPFAVVFAAVIGIPAYMNGYAAVPLISGLMDLGMSPGAALAFITAGAVSSIPAALAVYALVNRAVFFAYVGLGVTGSILSGYLYNYIGGF